MIRTILASFVCMMGVALAASTPHPAPNFVVHLTPTTQVTPQQHKGKVVVMAFIFTTCPHCQNTTVMLSSLQKEYGPKGLQVLGAAFNDNAVGLAPGFVSQFKPSFPVGYTSREEVMAFLGAPKDEGMYVPILAFIDRKGILRNFYPGDSTFTTGDQEKNLRTTIEQLLAEGGGAQKSAPPVVKKQTTVVITPSK